MEELFKETAGRIALTVELASALIIAYGALEAIIGLLTPRRRFEKKEAVPQTPTSLSSFWHVANFSPRV